MLKQREITLLLFLPVIRFFSSLSQIKQVFKSAKFPIETVTKKAGCKDSMHLNVTLSFDKGFPSGKTITGVFETALKNRAISNLTESNTKFTVKFAGE